MKSRQDFGEKVFRRQIKWIHRTNGEVLIRQDAGTFHKVNSTGLSILELCDGIHKVSEILEQFKTRYVDSNVQADVKIFLTNLEKLGFIKEVDYPFTEFHKVISRKEYTRIHSKLSAYLNKEGPPKPEYGQYYATAQTALHRALLLKLEGDLDNHDILFLGDDDLNSVAVGLMGGARRMTVLDIDPNVISTISKASRECSFKIDTVLHDLRHPPPSNLLGSFDVVVTDSYWDLYGILFFVIQGTRFLKKEDGKRMYFSLGYPFFEAHPEYFHETFPQGYVLSCLNEMKLKRHFIGYNEYKGSVEYAFLLMQSHLYILESESANFGPKLSLHAV